MELQDVFKILNDRDALTKDQKALLKRWKDIYYGISLHTTGACPKFKNLSNGQIIVPPNYFGQEYQNLFDKFLFSRHPRETDEQRMWRYSQYRPLTRAPFLQLTDIVVGAIFQDSNYSIVVENDDDREYIWKANFQGYDIAGWFANIGIPSMIEDPNGIIVRMPKRPFYEYSEGKIDVDLIFVNSKDIVFRNEHNLIFKYKGYAFWVNDRVIFRFTCDKNGKYHVSNEDARGYYAHLFGRLPIDVAGGVWNTQGFFDSFFSKAKPIADEYISSYSAEQLIDKEASHPFITLADDECPDCTNGEYTEVVDGQAVGLKKCSTCHGTGRIVSRNPGDRIYAPPSEMDKDFVKIVSPNTSVNEYHHKKNNDIFDNLLQSLGLLKVDASQSGVAKTIDKEELYKFISKISNHLFDNLIYNSLHDIIAYRNVVSVNGVLKPSIYSFSIIKPTQYQISTAEDLINIYEKTKTAGMPIFLRNKAVKAYVDREYSGDEVMRKKADVILELDKTAVFTVDEKLSQKTIGAFTVADLVFSDSLPSIIDELIRTKGERYFLNASLAALKSDIDSLMPQQPQPTNYFDESEFNQ